MTPEAQRIATTITERAAIVLQQIDEALALIDPSRTGWLTALRCLKTAIEGLLKAKKEYVILNKAVTFHRIDETLIRLCDQWEAGR